MSYIIEDNFVLKMFPFANFKTFHGGKNDWTIIKIKTKIIKIIFNVEEETDCGATRWNARFGRCNFPERGGNAGDVFLRAKNRAGRPADRSISQLSMRIWPSAWPCSAPTPPLLSRLIKRDSSMYSFMGRDFLSYWYARRWIQWRRGDREIILPFFPFKILAKNLKLIFLSALFFFLANDIDFGNERMEKSLTIDLLFEFKIIGIIVVKISMLNLMRKLCLLLWILL